MRFYDNFIVNPESFRVPTYNISPFTTASIKENYNICVSGEEPDEDLLCNTFGNHIFVTSGKSALNLALKQFKLNPEDEVWIVTTTGNKYISSCVTKEIEKFCRWSRTLSENTKVIFVNHEFGTVYRNMEEIINYGIPILEDKAMSLFSTDSAGKTGNYGDFTIYSLPKFFPVQSGGVLQINNGHKITSDLPEKDIMSLKKLASHYLLLSDRNKADRIRNYYFLSSHIAGLPFDTRFQLLPTEIPSVFMFTAREEFPLSDLKLFMQANGVECSVFYGENSFFIPVNQKLEQEDMMFFINLLKYFISENK